MSLLTDSRWLRMVEVIKEEYSVPEFLAEFLASIVHSLGVTTEGPLQSFLIDMYAAAAKIVKETLENPKLPPIPPVDPSTTN